jgi:hypothetical protein
MMMMVMAVVTAPRTLTPAKIVALHWIPVSEESGA